jgi:hypothetical protein
LQITLIQYTMKKITTIALFLLFVWPCDSDAQGQKPIDGASQVRNSTLGIVGFYGSPMYISGQPPIEEYYNADVVLQSGMTVQYQYQVWSNGKDHLQIGAGAGLNNALYRAPVIRFGKLEQNAFMNYKNGELQFLGGYSRTILEQVWALSINYNLSYLVPFASNGVAERITLHDYTQISYYRNVGSHTFTITGNPEVVHGLAISSILQVHPRVQVIGSYALSTARSVQYQTASNNQIYTLIPNETLAQSEVIVTEPTAISRKFSSLSLGVRFAW